VHLLGLIQLIGPISLLDLRLLGFGRRFAVVDVSAVLTAFAIAGLLLLFSADALPPHRHALLQAKLACIAVGLANAVAFRLVWTRRLADWDRHPPLPGRIHALLSLLMWPAVGTLGRLLAYR
jgi:hypothetical protein